MREMPLDIGALHFVGIGGIGMSGIAEVLHNLGYQVRGSDAAENANVKRLRGLGIDVRVGQRAENVADADVIVISSAIKPGNPELDAARAQLIPVVRRAEMLAELMRLKWSIAIGGTHGKTTTTSLIATMLDKAGLDPTIINGGIINAYGTNARLGAGDWMVVEADESDGTFTRLPATIAVITNIDPEHLDFYGDFDRLRDAFEHFITNVPFYGFAVICLDHGEVQAMIPRIHDRRLITYGFSPQAEVRAINLSGHPKGSVFDVVIADRTGGSEQVVEQVLLPMFGNHNVQNALAAVAIGVEMGIDPADIVAALREFGGVKRRFTLTGVVGGVTIIDDYGHHPVEIAAVLAAARQAVGTGSRVVAVVQPHRYTRLQSLFEDFCTCFNDANAVIVADIYAAGEQPIAGVDRDALVAGLRHHGHRLALALPEPAELAALAAELTQPGDMIVCLGAGSITQWAHALPAQLSARSGDPVGGI